MTKPLKMFSENSNWSKHYKLLCTLRIMIIIRLVCNVISVAPIVQLRVEGSSSKLKDIKEGEDVYFECNVRSNPRNFKLSWYHGVNMTFTHTTLRTASCVLTLDSYELLEMKKKKRF